jgi:DNA-directed RNA polymerase subunit RPC12/RpoP
MSRLIKIEIRCPRCGKLHGVLLRGKEFDIEVICLRCKKKFNIIDKKLHSQSIDNNNVKNKFCSL